MPGPATAYARLRVGEFEVDLRCGELRHNGDKVKLQERPFQILAALLERPGEVMTREEIQRKLWPADTFVDFEHSINTAVKKLREALGDDAENPRFIVTLPRRGYCLIAPVEVVGMNGTHLDVGISALPQVQAGTQSRPTLQQKRWGLAGALVTLLAIASLALLPSSWRRPDAHSSSAWVQITRFADGATSPAVSPDGRMIAFIRGPETFVTAGQIYVKMLPDGEPVQLTHDHSSKMAPVFSPDGSRIAYTATDANFGWNTWVVSTLGGEPHQLLPNAAALTWADRQHVVFSEMKAVDGSMNIATAPESRAGERQLYVPANWGMAHRSWVSPDSKWVLVSEMDSVGWRPCRLVPFDGSSSGDTVGPRTSRCTYAGWSPDGKTMYFSADAGDGYHVWRQVFPKGTPEQMTFGATEEEGIAVLPDGQTLITSAGIRESTVWVHDAHGDRQISGEGFAVVPGVGFDNPIVHSVFSPDGRRLFYLLRKQSSRAFTSGELCVADLDSGGSEAVLPGITMSEFDIAPDGERVAFSAPDAEGKSHVWVAPLDRRTPPKQLIYSVAQFPSFGPRGEIYFQVIEGGNGFVYRIGRDETAPQKVIAELASGFSGISPRGDVWLSDSSPLTAHPTQGGPPIRLCGFCAGGWGPGGKLFYLRFRDIGETGGGRMIVFGLLPGRELPKLPPSGIQSADDVKGANVVAEINMKDKAILAPGPNPSIYAYVRTTVQRNLFRIPLN